MRDKLSKGTLFKEFKTIRFKKQHLWKLQSANEKSEIFPQVTLYLKQVDISEIRSSSSVVKCTQALCH